MKARKALPAALLTLLALIVPALAGCSQVSALAPVSGDAITTLRIAIDDVLLENDVTILIAPKCTSSSGGTSCTGSTVEGEAITVTSPVTKPQTMTVKVGDTVLYTGDVESIVQKAAEATP